MIVPYSAHVCVILMCGRVKVPKTSWFYKEFQVFRGYYRHEEAKGPQWIQDKIWVRSKDMKRMEQDSQSPPCAEKADDYVLSLHVICSTTLFTGLSTGKYYVYKLILNHHDVLQWGCDQAVVFRWEHDRAGGAGEAEGEVLLRPV